MRTMLTVMTSVLVLGAALAGEQAAPPAFTKKPTATKAGDKVKVEFAVDRETDVAVYVEDAQGRIVRHLAAGVLGKKAPEPFKAGSLGRGLVTLNVDQRTGAGHAVLRR